MCVVRCDVLIAAQHSAAYDSCSHDNAQLSHHSGRSHINSVLSQLGRQQRDTLLNMLCHIALPINWLHHSTSFVTRSLNIPLRCLR